MTFTTTQLTIIINCLTFVRIILNLKEGDAYYSEINGIISECKKEFCERMKI